MPTTLPQYDEETDLSTSESSDTLYVLSGFTVEEARDSPIESLAGGLVAPDWSLSWVNIDTEDNCDYMVDWEFILWVWSDSYATPTLGGDAIGISVDVNDSDYTFYSTVAGDNIEDASFSGAFFNLDRITFTADVELGSSELDALGEIYNPPGGDLTNMVDSYVAEVAASSLGTMEAAHTFKKIETPEIDDETFDVIEGEEAAQAVTVSTTYTY